MPADPQDDTVFDPEVVSCTADEFRREMQYVRRFFDVISFADLANLDGTVRNPLIVTFDDGYKDNHDVVLPILRDLGLKATFFVTTGLIGTGKLPWWDEIAALVRQCEVARLCVEPWVREALAVDRPEKKQAAVAHLLRAAKGVPDGDRLRLMASLRDQGGSLRAGTADNVVMEAKRAGVRPLGVEGEQAAEWVLVDFGSVVVHVMLPATRDFYDLERLWEAPPAAPQE